MYMTKRRKVGVIIIILLGLITALIINMLYSSQPFVRWLFVSPKYGKVIFNNYNLQDTLQLAENYVEEGEGKSAFIVFNYILEKDPDNIEAYVGLADLYGGINNFKEAERYINEAEKRITSKTSPEIIADVYYHKAHIFSGEFKYEGVKILDEAIIYFNKVLNLEGLEENFKQSYESYIYYYLARIHSSLDKNDKTLFYYERSFQSDQTDKSLYYSLGISYIKVKDYENAYVNINKYIDIYGIDKQESLNGLGYYYTEIGEYEKALEYLAKAEQINPNLYSTLFLLGNYYEKTNNLEKAKEYYRKAFEVDKFMIQNKESQQIIERLNINVDDLKEEIEKEKEENYSKVFEL